jgi:hypothetical protein
MTAYVSNNKTSHLIHSQVPQFVRDDHETFVAFLEAYYRFMEQEDQVTNTSKNLVRNKDIDRAEEVFVEKFYDNFIALLPKNVIADKTLILKHVKDFYRSRGSEKSVRFLMRIMFGKEVEFYYPKRDILKASDGKWFVEKSVRVGNIAVNNTSNTIAYSNFVNKQITGLTTGAKATVETIDVYYEKGQLITELKLSNEYRSFQDGETVYCLFEEGPETKYLSAGLFSGVVINVSLAEGGSGYIEGATVPLEGGGGSGAQLIISSTTKGAMSSIGVQAPGAGFRVGDNILISGGGGTGAVANVLTVDTSDTYHPNTYQINKSTISLEANTPINNVRYSNLNSSIVNPYLDVVSNSMSYWTFANCGPILSCFVTVGGNNYISSPSLDAQSNTAIRSLGILGRLEIIDGGLSYVVGDELAFENPEGCYGVGARANVTNVAANGRIQAVSFQKMAGHHIGGSGYDSVVFPIITVVSNTGAGANIVASAILGDNETLISGASSYGKILELRLVSGGSGYSEAPTVNLAAMSSGSGAQAAASIVSGAYTYPGRFLNDDGFLSSFNFIQDRDYYQNYSYVIRIDEPVDSYRHVIKKLVHPAGTKLFGHYTKRDESPANVMFSIVPNTANTKLKQADYVVNINDITKTGTYNVRTMSFTYTPRTEEASYNVSRINVASFTSRQSSIILKAPGHTLRTGDNVFLKFHTSLYSNITNGLYTTTMANSDHIIVPIANGNSAYYAPSTVTSNLTLNTGSGNTNAYTILSTSLQNSNVVIATGDTIVYGSNLAVVLSSNASSNVMYLSPAFAGNLVNKVFSVTKKPYTAYGNVTITNPIVTLYRPNGSSSLFSVAPGDNVYLKFSGTSDTSLINTRYSVISANSKLLRVTHKDIANAVSLSGNANISFNHIAIAANNHGLEDNDPIFLYTITGDTGNVANGLYTVTEATQNTFNVYTTYPGSNTGNGYLRFANVDLNITSHGFANTENVYVWFTSGGDTSNISNGFITVSKRDANTVYFESANILSTNGTITVYRNYANVTLIRSNHGFAVGNSVSLLLDSGNTDRIPNGVYTVTTAPASNTLNIKHTGILVTSNLANLLPSNSGIAYIALHK